MKTRRQNLQVRHRAIHALLASAGIISSAWAQAQEPAPAILAPVEVTGDPYLSEVSVAGKEPVKPREIPQSVSVITKEQIEDQGLATVTDVLNQATGVSVQSGDTQTGSFRSRGYNIDVAIDGVPAFEALNGVQQLDAAVYERVEVLRGAAGLFQGSSFQPGGVVNLVRKRGQKEFAASASLSAGSWNHYNTVADAGGPLKADGSLRGRVVASATDREYFYDTTRTKKYLGYATLDWDLTPATTLSFALASQNDDTKAPFHGLPAWATSAGENANKQIGLSRSTNLNTDWSRSEWDTQDLLLELVHRFDNGWRVTAKLNHREQDLQYRYGRPNGGLTAAGTLNYYREGGDFTYEWNGFDLYAAGPFRLFGREHRAVLGYNRDESSSTIKYATPASVPGISLGHQDLVPDFDDPYSMGSEYEDRQSGFYGQLRFRLTDPLTVIVGARVSDFLERSREVAPSPRTDWVDDYEERGEVTPYAGVIFDASRQISLYASYSDIFAPQNSQKFGGGILEPRIGKQYEIGAKGEFLDGRLIASLAYYNLRDKNRAVLDLDHSGGGVYYYLAAGEVESKGWEVEVSGSPAPGWNIQTGYARQDTRYLKDAANPANEGLPFNPVNPKHTFKLWGTYRFGGGALGGLTAGLGVNHSSKTHQANTAASEARAAKAYTVANAFLSYRIDKNLSLSFNVNNLFDKTYYIRSGNTSVWNFYGEPRSYALTLRATY
ncbi:MAG: TonB-dependent siderophore receptor [Candidatus Accumulibacter sp.]|jgi:outer membrane receptor for ferric coprogen and ferric-rhodotorulic acid|nr:TonB-dependent siderophore receptor [Accumulibacter sp.]